MIKPNSIKNINEVNEELHYLDEPEELYRTRRRLGKATGANRIGINYCHLQPGQVSSKFHYNTCEEEFFFVLNGNIVLRHSDDKYDLSSGDCVSMKPGGPAHQLINNADEECIYLAIGTRDQEDSIIYPEDDNQDDKR